MSFLLMAEVQKFLTLPQQVENVKFFDSVEQSEQPEAEEHRETGAKMKNQRHLTAFVHLFVHTPKPLVTNKALKPLDQQNV